MWLPKGHKIVLFTAWAVGIAAWAMGVIGNHGLGRIRYDNVAVRVGQAVFPCCVLVCVVTGFHAIYWVGRGGRK